MDKYEKRIIKDWNLGRDYKFIAFKYNVSEPKVLNIVERNKKRKIK